MRCARQRGRPQRGCAAAGRAQRSGFAMQVAARVASPRAPGGEACTCAGSRPHRRDGGSVAFQRTFAGRSKSARDRRFFGSFRGLAGWALARRRSRRAGAWVRPQCARGRPRRAQGAARGVGRAQRLRLRARLGLQPPRMAAATPPAAASAAARAQKCANPACTTAQEKARARRARRRRGARRCAALLPRAPRCVAAPPALHAASPLQDTPMWRKGWPLEGGGNAGALRRHAGRRAARARPNLGRPQRSATRAASSSSAAGTAPGACARAAAAAPPPPRRSRRAGLLIGSVCAGVTQSTGRRRTRPPPARRRRRSGCPATTATRGATRRARRSTRRCAGASKP
jgi:hypothetical protein